MNDQDIENFMQSIRQEAEILFSEIKYKVDGKVNQEIDCKMRGIIRQFQNYLTQIQKIVSEMEDFQELLQYIKYKKSSHKVDHEMD